VLVGVGGALGSVARYWLGGVVQQVAGSSFPLGTLVVNVLGSFLIGVVMARGLERGLVSPEARIFMTTGFCGGFTTMSTFSYETLALLREGSELAATTNAVGTFAACVGAAWLGQLVGRIL